MTAFINYKLRWATKSRIKAEVQLLFLVFINKNLINSINKGVFFVRRSAMRSLMEDADDRAKINLSKWVIVCSWV